MRGIDAPRRYGWALGRQRWERPFKRKGRSQSGGQAPAKGRCHHNIRGSTSFIRPRRGFVFANALFRVNTDRNTGATGLWKVPEKEYIDTVTPALQPALRGLSILSAQCGAKLQRSLQSRPEPHDSHL